MDQDVPDSSHFGFPAIHPFPSLARTAPMQVHHASGKSCPVHEATGVARRQLRLYCRGNQGESRLLYCWWGRNPFRLQIGPHIEQFIQFLIQCAEVR